MKIKMHGEEIMRTNTCVSNEACVYLESEHQANMSNCFDIRGFLLLLFLFVLCSTLCFVPDPVFADTNVGGTVSENSTWTLAEAPYIVTGDLTVAEGVTLTVEPGVVVKFDSSRRMTINGSLNETLGRSLNTSLTTMFVLVALYLFGGVTIQNFILVLLIGVIVGTYSSVAIASQLLVVWDKRGLPRVFRRLRPSRTPLRGA